MKEGVPMTISTLELPYIINVTDASKPITIMSPTDLFIGYPFFGCLFLDTKFNVDYSRYEPCPYFSKYVYKLDVSRVPSHKITIAPNSTVPLRAGIMYVTVGDNSVKPGARII